MESTEPQMDQENSNDSTTPGPEESIHPSFSILRCFLLVITTLLILTLNPFYLLILRHVNSIQETTKVFLRAMTIADIGVGISVAIPATISAFLGDWPFGDVVCTLQAAANVFVYCIALFFLLIITVDRYISVVYALRYPSLVTVKRARIAVCCAGGLSTLIPIVNGFITTWETLYLPPALVCEFKLSNQNTSNIYTKVFFTILITFSLLVVFMTYIRLFLISRHHARQIEALNIALGGNQPPQPPPRTNNKSLQTTLFIVLTSFFLNVVPIVCYITLDTDTNSHVEIFYLFFLLLPLLTQSWVNGICYYLSNTDFRQTANRLLKTHYQLCKNHIPFNGNT
ncbi:beta-4C adrenergic receptor-like [Asterias amurensis]|uniref:beta-4C adrenergic receptor-like n=1 Tax=Asterias amurensis TaxID=7602 RepID=UPI003AB42434